MQEAFLYKFKDSHMFQWSFPICDGGAQDGPSEAGMATFRGQRIASLGKELVQNSLDASSGQGLVHVNFQLQNIPRRDFDAPYQLEKYIDLIDCYPAWKSNKDAKNLITKLRKSLNSEQLNYLIISDFNTTGLSGANNKNLGAWGALVKGSGINFKNTEGALGSHGIGKSAAFANSALNMVFYSSLDESGVYAFQGATRLISFAAVDIVYRAHGYWGVKEDKAPILDKNLIPRLFLRDQVGTSVIVPAFEFDDDWELSLLKSIVSAFYVPILEKQLKITVGSYQIDNNSLSDVIEKIQEKFTTWETPHFIKAILSSETEITVGNILDADDCSLYVLEGEEFHKTCALLRGRGMQIFTITRFKTPNRFVAVFRPKPQSKLDEILRGCENPSHDKWEGERYETNIKLAKNVVKETQAWIRRVIKELTPDLNQESSDLSGMSSFFPDESSQDRNSTESLTEISENYRSTPKFHNSFSSEIKLGEIIPMISKKIDGTTKVGSGKSSKNPGEKDSSPTGEGKDVSREGKGKPTITKAPGVQTGQTDEGEDGVGSEVDAPDGSRLKRFEKNANARLISTSPKSGIFTLLGKGEGLKKIFVRLVVVGDDGEAPISALSATNINGDPLVITKDGCIGPVDVINGSYKITLTAKQKYSLSVRVEEYEIIK